jgi:hypothetical protein
MIDSAGIMSRVKAFHQKHSVEGPSVQFDGFIRYPDGAYRDIDPIGLLADPSPNEFERLSAIVLYHNGRPR